MKNKNMREMERHWAEQRKKAAKQAKAPAPPKREGEKPATPAPAESADKA